jgi:hypothetical protein
MIKEQEKQGAWELKEKDWTSKKREWQDKVKERDAKIVNLKEDKDLSLVELEETRHVVESMQQNLMIKGEELGEMAQKLMELENQALDREAFDNSYHVKLYGSEQNRKLQFVRDTSEAGEFFLEFSVPQAF